MTRKRRNISDADVDRWTRQGFGQGEGDHFKPWAKVRDVPSIGRSARVAGLKHWRTHHLYSDVELGHFIMADFRPGVEEIREQVALLPRDETIEIAERLGIRHPCYPGTSTPVVITSDIQVLAQGRDDPINFVVSVKRRESLLPGAKGLARTIQKLTLERRYWQDRGVPWYLATEGHYNSTEVRNLSLLRPDRRAWLSEERCNAALEIVERIRRLPRSGASIRAFLSKLPQGADIGLRDFGLAVWKRWLGLDLTRDLRWNSPIPLKEVRGAGQHNSSSCR